ncbi:MAG: bifunctional phosphoribosylaminoimidazolecarboxamide formyltransferase/IMP cyclohydrolase [Alphaproteobacteria bacterium GM202ARS2]|nr:bifunctional phosphoribosylaminoimidazolecarboxamide formyltransferase/IMP cyclohydrolase [Alphaproteobacteria bacterium GM202ARS2]
MTSSQAHKAKGALPIRRALISVYDKSGIVPFARCLADHGIHILSTGGTYDTLKQNAILATEVEEITSFPSILDGRVKTLHPHIHAGILAKGDDPKHKKTLQDLGIEPIDLVVVNLYPFIDRVTQKQPPPLMIESIDIGGPCLIRAAAKNYQHTVVATQPEHYQAIMDAIQAGQGISLALRQHLAERAFAHTAYYDATIHDWFASTLPSDKTDESPPPPPFIFFVGRLCQPLRYGENPDQQAALYRQVVPHKALTTAALSDATVHQGKALSWNNIHDSAAALRLVREFTQPTIVIIKHANPCGVASDTTLSQAWLKALACDPTSAFGGIVACNRPIDADCAEHLTQLFLEVVIAPSISKEALALLQAKKNLRLLTSETLCMPTATQAPAWDIRAVEGNLLIQERQQTRLSKESLCCVTKKHPTEQQWRDVLFAAKVCKHVTSNAIVYAADGATLAIGGGQTSRIDSVRIASHKSAHARKTAPNVVAASDAFFPFADTIEQMAQDGITAIIQPGGALKDKEVIQAADKHAIAMVFSGTRHFKH